MSRALFLDTSGWFAAMSGREAGHAEALTVYERALRDGVALVTTNLVLGEMHVLLTRFLGPRPALEFLDRVRSDTRHEVVWCDADLAGAAMDRWLRPFGTQRFSLCDAVSFEVMHGRRIRRALALDKHFAVAGYETLVAPA